ncbi:hypothetical protein PV409_36280 [Streptomyces sp. ME02-6979.5a]|uniref:hypothetical protein n=1 Tax=Streptomyces sp. ME02-6979.5a TaxID=462925 RepID=UPI0029BEA932|nr:hypothetical protein [Streptomyces sp. ME02-6979.5a]MDX3343419.1 hypothetical protein [Streptomyces sp. ME02-6979.5a]
MNDITRTQLEGLADFFATITPATEAEQAGQDLLNSNREAFITKLATPTIEAAVAGGTVTTTLLYSPERLAEARATRTRRTSTAS